MTENIQKHITIGFSQKIVTHFAWVNIIFTQKFNDTKTVRFFDECIISRAYHLQLKCYRVQMHYISNEYLFRKTLVSYWDPE